MIAAKKGETARFVNRLVNYIHYRWERYYYRSDFHPLRRARIARAEATARRYFELSEGRRDLVRLFSKSKSTGASIIDYHLLHRYVVSRRPSRILEFGSGVTTVVMAHGLSEAFAAHPDEPAGHLYSMEDIPRFHDDVRELIPESLSSYVTALLSEKCESEWRGEIWGFHYAEIPRGPFDFVFVDGPTESKGGRKGACLDLLHVLERQPDTPLDVVVDQKFSSLRAYQSVLPKRSVAYDPITDTGTIVKIRGADLRATALTPMPGPSRGDAWRRLRIEAGAS